MANRKLSEEHRRKISEGVRRSLAGRSKPNIGWPRQSAPFAYFTGQLDVPGELSLTIIQRMNLSVVYAAVKAIAEDVGRSPWNIFEERPDGSRVKRLDDPIRYVLNQRASPPIMASAWRECMIVQAMCFGNGYSEIVKDSSGGVEGAGKVKELRVLPSDRVLPLFAAGGEQLDTFPPRLAVRGELYYKFGDGSGGFINYGLEQVFHLPALSTVDGVMGDAVLARAAMALAVSHAMQQHQANYFANNAMLGGVLKFPPGVLPKPEEQDAILATWNAKYQGVGNAFKMLLTNADYQAITTDADRSQLLQSRQFMVQEVCRYFRIPPHKVQDHPQSAPGRSGELLDIDYVRDCLKPWSHRFEQEADFKLFPQGIPWRMTEIDLSEFVRGDDQTRAAACKAWIEGGIRTPNECREMEGEEHSNDPAADRLYISNTLVPLDEEIMAAKVEQASKPPPPPAVTPGANGQVPTPPTNGKGATGTEGAKA